MIDDVPQLASASEEVLAHRYRVRRSLGRGGMGQVWLAEDLTGGDEVAVKVLTAQLAGDPASVLQVKQEFRLMTQLRHPNCCEVHDYGFLADGSPYFTMEVVPGEGLDAAIPMAAVRLRPLLVQLLRALAYVHQRGYVHGDIKAENVRVKPDGTLKLMDFGLMVHAGAAGLPIRGTLGYMPPEVIRRGPVDQRSDLYAVGCLAFEALTGALPFVRPRPMEVLQAHLGEPPPIRARMVDDDGLDWSPILARLLAKDPIARYQAAEDVLEALGEEVAGGLGGKVLTAQLVGRDAELEALQARIDAVRRGEPGGAVVLHGAGGSGKSRLLAELRIRAQLDHVPFGLGASHRHGTMPYGAVVGALRALLPALREVVPALLAELAPVLLAVLPEAGRGPDGVAIAPAPELDGPEKEKARLFGAITRLLVALAAARGLVLAFEDWHFADVLSAELVAHLRRNADGERLLVIFTALAAPPAAPWMAETAAIPLDGLAPEASARLIGSMLGTDDVPAAFLAKMQALSAGNPQLLEGAIEHLVQTLVLTRQGRRWGFEVDWDEGLLPANQLGLLHRRLSFLGPDALALASVAAVMGRPTDLAELLAVSGQPEDRLFEALEQLQDLQVLRRDEDGAWFLDHDALVPLLYDPIEAAEKRRLHALALAHLVAAAGPRPLDQLPLEQVAQLARHAVGAADDAAAIRYALEAGKRSTMIYANDEAARLLEGGLALARAAGHEAQVDFQRFLADVYRVTGRYDEALPLYGEAIAGAEARGDALTLGRVRTSLAKLHMVRDELEEALAASRQALAASAGAGHGPVTLRAMLTETRALFYLGRTQDAAQVADAALALARSLDQSTLIAQASSLRGYLEVASPEPDVALGVALLQEASARFMEVGDRLGLYNAMNLLGNALLSMGDYAEAAQAFEGTRLLAHELGAKDDETFAWLNLALVALEVGRPVEARAAAARALALAKELQSTFTQGMATALEAAARARLGEAAEAERQLAETIAQAKAIKSKYMELLARQQQVETLLYLGAFDAALEAAAAWKALKAETGNTEGAARLAALEGAALLGLGRDADAEAVLAQALASAATARAKGDEARARGTLARLAARAGRHEEADGLAADALALATRIGAKGLATELQGLRGELDLAAGRPAEAAFRAMEAAAGDADDPALLALALFGRAAAAPYLPGAADLVEAARASLERALRGLDATARARFLAYPDRRRVIDGNHIAYSLPTTRQARRTPTGPLGLGLGGL